VFAAGIPPRLTAPLVMLAWPMTTFAEALLEAGTVL